MPPMSVLIKPVSGLCNMSCEYCFYCDEAKKRTQESFGIMSEQTLKNVIRKTMLKADDMISYAFQGGEPTLRGLGFFEKVICYQRQYNKKNLVVHNSLQTNGYTLTEEWCQFLKENHFLIGLSIDGIESIHNALRHSKDGKATFQRILCSAKLMDQFQIDYNILTVVTPAVAQNITEIYHFYKAQGWYYQQYIACLDPLDEIRGNKMYSLQPEIYGQFLAELFDLWEKDLQNGEQPYIRQFDNYVGLAAGFLIEACDQKGTCGIQNVVEADGSVYPCDFYVLDQYRLGNFNEDQYDQIEKKRSEILFIERSEKIDPQCMECKYYKLCRGGCYRNRDYQRESGFYTNYFCSAYKSFFDSCYSRILEIAQQKVFQ